MNGPDGKSAASGPLWFRREVWRPVSLAGAWALTALGAVFVLLHVLPELQLLHRRAALIASFIPFGIVAWAAALALFLAAGRRWGKALALAAVPGLAAQLAWAAPYLPASPPAPSQPGGTSILTFNSRCDSSGQEELAASLLQHRPDVVVLQGVPTAQREHLATAGVPAVYPHQVFFPMPGYPSCGTVIYSQAPMSATPRSTPTHPAVHLAAAGGVVLVPVDVIGPQRTLSEWAAGIERVGETAAAYQREPVIVAGDFNAVREHAPFRRLLADTGLRNAADVAGAGWLPTFPADRWYPPLLEIDHVLVGPGIAVSALETLRVGGHAHRGLVAHVTVSDSTL